MGDTNLFDHGQSSQAGIIKPFIRRIRDNLAGKPLNPKNREFFFQQLRSLVAMLSELENRPKWVKDTESYRLKSEVVAFLSLLTALNLPDEPSSTEQELVSTLYEEAKEFGEERGWDPQILHVQFIRAMGTKVQNYIMKIVMPRTLKPIDYN